jgi:hypothetical protein
VVVVLLLDIVLLQWAARAGGMYHLLVQAEQVVAVDIRLVVPEQVAAAALACLDKVAAVVPEEQVLILDTVAAVDQVAATDLADQWVPVPAAHMAVVVVLLLLKRPEVAEVVWPILITIMLVLQLLTQLW